MTLTRTSLKTQNVLGALIGLLFIVALSAFVIHRPASRLIQRYSVPDSRGIVDFEVGPSGSMAYLACADGGVRRIDLRSGRITNLTSSFAPIRKLDYDERRQTLLVAFENGRVNCLDATTGQERSTALPFLSILALARIGDYAVALTSTESRKLKLLSLDLHSTVGDIDGLGGPQLAVSPDNSRLAVWEGLRGKIVVIDIRTRRQVANFAGHDLIVSGLTFADSDTLISIGDDALCKVWDIRSSRCVNEAASESYLTAVAFSKEASIVATGDVDGRIQVWKWPTLEPLFVEVAHRGAPVSQLKLIRGGKKLVSSSSEAKQADHKRSGEIAVWRIE